MAIERLGFIGLGVMGGRMCRNLARGSGLPVVAYDIDPARAEVLASAGVNAALSVREVMEAADLVFICVPGEPQVRAVCLGAGGVMAHARAGQTVVDMTTATVEVARDVEAALAARGVDFADAPVARGVPSAEDGTLSIMVGGTSEVFARIEPFLAHMGTDISHCGPVGTGQVVKLMNNMLVFQTVSALSEAMAIATRAGVARERLFEVLQHGSSDSFVMRRHGSHITSGQYPDDVFPTRYSLKDIGYALDLAEQVGVDAQGARVARDRLAAAIDRGWGDYYCPVIYRLFEET
ncbi:MAG: NAD(P)-dependent oxidoreductase [Chloroflexi bacterium]|nr:NAD(P)-dependent oxidoreductase [Chloroflexota bacterium]MDA1241050.1 NAD(P)-dependent oxidoreductase [Chloroflexota bacterium]